MQNSYVQYTPKDPLILLTVEKSECENFTFVPLFTFPPFLLPFFPSCITQKVYGIYEQSAHLTTALLSQLLLFLVRATFKLKWASYGSKYAS